MNERPVDALTRNLLARPKQKYDSKFKAFVSCCVIVFLRSDGIVSTDRNIKVMPCCHRAPFKAPNSAEHP